MKKSFDVLFIKKKSPHPFGRNNIFITYKKKNLLDRLKKYITYEYRDTRIFKANRKLNELKLDCNR